MKHKYQKLFWVWVGLAIILTALLVLFLLFISRKPINRFFIGYLVILSPTFINGFFHAFILMNMEKMSSIARKSLSFEEYFDVKRRYKLPLNKKDIAYAPQKIEEKNWSDFLKSFDYKDTETKSTVFIRGFVIVIMMIGFLLQIISDFTGLFILIVLSYGLIIIGITIFSIFLFKPMKNLFLFVKKVDELLKKKED